MSAPELAMKLLRVAWEEWEVLAACDPEGRCQVLDALLAAERTGPAAAELALAITVFLRHGVPADGPPRGEPARPLGLGLFELRQQLRGQSLRVVWFHGGPRRIVCALALGPAEKAPHLRIEETRVLRRQYFAAKGANRLAVVDLEDRAGEESLAPYQTLFARAEASVDYWSELAALEFSWHVERPFDSLGGLAPQGADGAVGAGHSCANQRQSETITGMREDTPPRAPLPRLRELCLALPEATERLSHGEPTWFVRDKKTFVTYADHHHNDRVAFVCAAPDGAQETRVGAHPERFFVPPYVGGRGWLGVYLDVPVDWNEIADLVTDAYRMVAPKKLLDQLDRQE